MSGSMQRGAALAAALVLLAALGWTILRPAGQYRVTAFFTETVGLYPGSDVRVLGIPVGTITDVVPLGDRVRVEMSIDDDYDIPADADAVVLAPSLVSDRYVQFAPVYDGGPKMTDGAQVPLERTAIPVELDAVYGALDELSAALGPNGANKNGALSDLVDTGAANLDGNGEALNRTLTGFSKAVRTLAENRDNLFGSLDNLQTFTSALASIDAQVGQFNDNMAAVSEQLAGEREDLESAIALLDQALGDIARFVRDNRTLLTTNVDRLADVTLTLVRSGAPWPRCSRSPLQRWATSPAPTTPTTGRWTPGTTASAR
jgi:virulence factor Mce-like protein